MRQSVSSILLVLGLGSSLLGLQSCGGEKETVRSTGTALDGRRFSDPEFACKTTPPESADAAALALDAAAPNYNDDIKPLLTAKCTGCHMSGGTPPDLSTYALAKAAAEVSASEIEAGSMPTAGALPTADQTLFRAWVTGGTPEAAAPVGGDDGAATDAGGGDGTTDGVGEGPADGGDGAATDDAGADDAGADDAGTDGTSSDAAPAEVNCPAPAEGAP